MKKQIILLMMVGMLVLTGVTGCGQSNDQGEGPAAEQEQVEQEVTGQEIAAGEAEEEAAVEPEEEAAEEAGEAEEEKQAAVEPKPEEAAPPVQPATPEPVPAEPAPEPDQDWKLVEESPGVWTYLDLETSPVEGGGVKTQVTTGEAGTVRFTVTQPDGTETVDYYEFIPAQGLMHRYRMVAAMGTAYNYYYDYVSDTMNSIANGKGEDVTESMKQSGRWESAVQENGQWAQTFLNYFEETFGATIEEAVAQ